MYKGYLNRTEELNLYALLFLSDESLLHIIVHLHMLHTYVCKPHMNTHTYTSMCVYIYVHTYVRMYMHNKSLIH